jgi:ssDNA-binding Zn-finger/Zn-ribbon topoisomerase 1
MKPENVTCPDCNAPMVARRSVNGAFWGCSRYPRCKGTRNADGEARRPKYRTDADGYRRTADVEEEAVLPSERWHGRDRRRWDR